MNYTIDSSKTKCIELFGGWIIVPDNSDWVYFGEDAHPSVSYKFIIPSRDNEIKFTADNFLGSKEEARSYAYDQYQVNSRFSSDEFNANVALFSFSDPNIEGFDYHFSNGLFPSSFIHIIFACFGNNIVKFSLFIPLEQKETADPIFTEIVRAFCLK